MLMEKLWQIFPNNNLTYLHFFQPINTDDDLVFYIPINIIQTILRQWKGDNKMSCAMKRHKLNSASSGIQTPDLVVRSWKC